MSESLARKSFRVLREDGPIALVRRGTRSVIVPKLLELRVVYGPLGSIGYLLSEARTRKRYAAYRRRYDIHETFDFPKSGTFLGGDGTISIAAGGHVGGYSVLDAYEGTSISIGRNVHIGTNVHMYTGNYDAGADMDRPGYEIERNVGDIVIGNGVWIGDNVVVTPGTEIGSSVVIGANAVVTKDVPSGTVVGGVPARELSERDGSGRSR